MPCQKSETTDIADCRQITTFAPTKTTIGHLENDKSNFDTDKGCADALFLSADP